MHPLLVSKIHHTSKKGVYVLGMTLNCIWLWVFKLWGIQSPFHCHYSQVHSDPDWWYLLGYCQWVKYICLKIISLIGICESISVCRTNDYHQIELLFERNTWNDKTVCKLFVLRIVSWSYDWLFRIITYLNPYNYVNLCMGASNMLTVSFAEWSAVTVDV